MNLLKKNVFVLCSCMMLFTLFLSCKKNQNLSQVPTETSGLNQKEAATTLANAPVHGTGWIEKTFTYNIHKPWNLPLSDRYSYDPTYDEHTFWIYPKDSSFQEGSATSPRCEMRINNNYTTGDHQFEADYKVYSGSNHPVVMQVFGGATDATAFNMKAYDENGGTFKHYDSQVIQTGIFDTWFHVNVIHSTSLRKVYVYINGALKGTFNDKGASTHYFKCGVYTCISSLSKVKIKHIKYYSRP